MHPEFFRVAAPGREHAVSLVARHVTPRAENGEREPMASEFVGQLLKTAIDLHDRQVRRDERWTYLVPIWVALIVGISSVGTIVVKWLFRMS
jgi:hypothetical protein